MVYDPKKAYTRRELIELIRPHGKLLCFFAQQTGEKRCVLGVDFDKYDRASQMVPVHIVPEWAVRQVLIPAEGSRFKKAYRDSAVGQKIVVTFTSRQASGWFEMRWELEEGEVKQG
jgi:hypothetical protein